MYARARILAYNGFRRPRISQFEQICHRLASKASPNALPWNSVNNVLARHASGGFKGWISKISGNPKEEDLDVDLDLSTPNVKRRILNKRAGVVDSPEN
jgi:hypothetical protein